MANKQSIPKPAKKSPGAKLKEKLKEFGDGAGNAIGEALSKR